MKTEQITSPQQEQSIQRSNAHKARHGSKPDGADAPTNPFAQLLAGLGQAPSETQEDVPDAAKDALTQPQDPSTLTPQTPTWLTMALQQSANAATSTDNAPPTSPGHKPGGKGVGLLSTADLQKNPREDHSGPGHLVSAQARSQDRELPPPMAVAQNAPPPSTDGPSWHMLTPGHPGSALATEATPTAPVGSPSSDTPTLGSVTSTDNRSNPETSPQGQGQPDLQGGDSTASTSGTDPSAATTQADSFAQNLDQAMNNLGAQVSYWASQNIRRASMQLDLGRRGALSVDVRLKDGKAQVDFLSNDSQTRDALQSQAHQQLSQMLQQHGIALEGLSVGSQGTQNGSAYNQASDQGWAPLNPPKVAETAQAPLTASSARRTSGTTPGALDEFV